MTVINLMGMHSVNSVHKRRAVNSNTGIHKHEPQMINSILQIRLKTRMKGG